MTAEEAIRAAILDHGPITFAEFMSLALYGESGYYRSGTPISASGDYFTAPAAHPLFGALIALQLQEMWDLLGRPGDFTVVEHGAGSGILAADINHYAARLEPDFATSLKYVATDIAPPEHQHYPVVELSSSPIGITGCLLSNELIDAMPVHRFQVQEGKAREIFVGLDGDNLVEVISDPSDSRIQERLERYAKTLPSGYRGEINLQLEEWARMQSSVLERGWLLTFDYGFERDELYKPERTSGSLRTYSQHTLGQNPLRNPGKQDITSHVDFTAVDEALTAAGFRSAGRTTQADFLTRMGLTNVRSQLVDAGLSIPDRRANEAGIEALVNADGMGTFVAAGYGKNVGALQLTGFHGTAAPAHVPLRSVPLLQPGRHIRLTGGGQQPGYFEVQSLEDLYSDPD